jgi:hypothetical protein
MNQNNQYLKFRLLLTVLWIIFFLIALGICESYIHVLKDGKVYMTFSERPLFIKPISLLYSPYIAGILAFWFINPFLPAQTEIAAKYKMIIAFSVTIIFNILLLFIISQAYLSKSGDSNIIEDVDFAIKMAAWLSFLVAPVNAYYFGTKSPT